MKLIVICLFLVAVTGCRGLSVEDVNALIDRSVATAIADIPEPTAIPVPMLPAGIDPSGISTFDVIRVNRIEVQDGNDTKIIIDANIPRRGAEIQILPDSDGAAISLGNFWGGFAVERGDHKTLLTVDRLDVGGGGSQFSYTTKYGLHIDAANGSHLIFWPEKPCFSVSNGKTDVMWAITP